MMAYYNPYIYIYITGYSSITPLYHQNNQPGPQNVEISVVLGFFRVSALVSNPHLWPRIQCTLQLLRYKKWGPSRPKFQRPRWVLPVRCLFGWLFLRDLFRGDFCDIHLGDQKVTWKKLVMVNYWFGARWFGFLESPKMKGIGILILGVPPKIQNHRARNQQLTIS